MVGRKCEQAFSWPHPPAIWPHPSPSPVRRLCHSLHSNESHTCAWILPCPEHSQCSDLWREGSKHLSPALTLATYMYFSRTFFPSCGFLLCLLSLHLSSFPPFLLFSLLPPSLPPSLPHQPTLPVCASLPLLWCMSTHGNDKL